MLRQSKSKEFITYSEIFLVSFNEYPMFQTAKLLRFTLGSLLLFIALNAFAGGYYGMMGAEGVPVQWLEGTPFSSYLVPSVILFVVVGGVCLFGAIAVFQNKPFARKTAIAGAVILLIWLAVQVFFIGYVSWMQPATAIAAVIVLFLALLLPRYDY